MKDELRVLLACTGQALGTAAVYLAQARAAPRAELAPDGEMEPTRLEARQVAGHALAWTATAVEALRQIRNWALRLDEAGAFGQAEALILETAFGEYLAQLAGGIPMAQGEFARPHEFGLDDGATTALRGGEAGRLLAGLAEARSRLGALMANAAAEGFGHIGLDDTTLDMIRDQVRRFAVRAVVPFAQEWHRQDQLIPLPLIEELAEIGVFGLTIPEQHGGLGLGKMAMCVVSEELSRGYLGVGSLGTRSEIAGGADSGLAAPSRKRAQLAAGNRRGRGCCRPQFSPNPVPAPISAAVADSGGARRRHSIGFTAHKTWITHGARSDLMTLLARTDPAERGYRGLSACFWRQKPRGSDAEPFPADGDERHRDPGARLPRHEGVRDRVSTDLPCRPTGLLGRGRRPGFQTADGDIRERPASRPRRAAIGVAQTAHRAGACAMRIERQSVRHDPLAAFPRVARQARADGGRDRWRRASSPIVAARRKGWRRDAAIIEAGMAKLLAARVAWCECRQCACRSTAATAMRWNVRSAGCCATRAS